MNTLNTIIRLLTFKLTREEMLQFNRSHFMAGLIGTWLVGMGRYWDDNAAKLLQHLGLGSVIYIFLLAVLIWLILLPFKVEKWTYFMVPRDCGSLETWTTVLFSKTIYSIGTREYTDRNLDAYMFNYFSLDCIKLTSGCF